MLQWFYPTIALGGKSKLLNVRWNKNENLTFCQKLFR